MKAAKIMSLIGIVIYSYFALKLPFNLGVFGQILSQSNQSIQPIIIGMRGTAIVGVILNVIFFIFILFKEIKGLKITRASFISLLLLIVPILVMYIFFATVANRVYNLS